MDQGEAVHVMNNCREDERKCRTDKNGLTEEEFDGDKVKYLLR